MHIKSVIPALILIMLYSGTVFSNSNNIGTTASNYLKIIIPAKPAALGEAYTALADDIDSIFYNPAGAGRVMSAEISAAHAIWLGDLNYTNLSVLLPFSFGNLSFFINSMYFLDSKNPMLSTQPSPLPPYYTTGEVISPGLIMGGLTFSREFTDNLFVGAGIKIMSYSIVPQDPNGTALSFIADFGIIYEMPFLRGLSAGLTFRNVGPETMFRGDGDMQPFDIRGGIGYSGSIFSLEADAEYISDNAPNYFIGGSVKLFDILSLRAGWKGGTINQPTFGGGIDINRFNIDYAFVPFNEEDLGMTHRVTLSYQFGAPPAKIMFNPPVFSPNRDKFVDYSGLNKEVISKGKVKSYTLTISDAFGSVVRKYNLPNPNIRMFWNGYNSMNMAVPDGEYFAALGVNYGGGITADSNKAKVEVDNTPPTVSVDANPKIVKPGAMTTLMCPVTFSPSLYDLHGIGRWKLIITSADGKIFKTFTGNGDPLNIIWDGSDDTGLNNVSTGATYGYTFYAMDTVGNWGRSATSSVKVLLREIVINLASDTLFDIGKADVKISVYKDLQKISEQIKGLGNPSVIVEGHTDNQPLKRGTYADNAELSEYRAKAVVKFLVELFSMNSRTFTAVGKGDTVPVASNDTAEGRKKNRRVTLRIQASKWE